MAQRRTVYLSLLGIFAAAALCLAVPENVRYVRVFVDAPVSAAAKAESLVHDLAARISRGRTSVSRTGDESEADVILRLYLVWSGERSDEDAESDYILSRTPYAPVAKIGDPGSSPEDLIRALSRAISCKDLDSDADIRPLDSIRPPWVALPVSGITADQSGYPLVRELRVGADFPGPRGRRHADSIREALASLANKSDNRNPAPKILWLAAGGDIMTGRGIEGRLLRGGAETVFDPEILELLRDSDLAAANLEGALTDRGTRAEKRFTFRSSPAVASGLGDAGLDVLLLANNHSLDWGYEGLADTLAALDRAGLAGIGAGTDLERASRPYRLSRKGQDIAVYAAAYFPREQSGWDGASSAAGPARAGIHWMNQDGLARARDSFRGDGISVVLLHGGEEWSRGPSPELRRVAEDLVQAGADAVIVSHPHVVQGMEWIRGKPVFWSLGNFVFPGMDGTPGGEEGLLVRAGFLDGRVLYVRVLPVSVTSDGARTSEKYR